MSMPTPSLKEFAQAIPVCKQTSGLAAVLDICCSCDCDKIVIVSEQQCPLGVVSLRQAMLHMVSSVRFDEPSAARTTIDFQKPLSQLNPSVIEPLAILPAQMSLSQFWPYLQELGAKPTPNRQQQTEDWTQAGVGNVPPSPSLSQASSISSQHWALVDEQGKFLGLLNSWLLLKFLTQNATATDAAYISEQPQPSTLTQLVQLLEQLPLPLSLQTATGQVLAENITWRQQIGTSPNLNWVRHTTAAMLDSLSIEPCSVLRTDGAITEGSSTLPENSTTFHPEALAQQSERSVSVSTASKGSMASAEEELAGRSSVKLSTRVESPVATNPITKQHDEFSPQACVQRYCAIDTPCMAATVSQRQAILSAPPISKNHYTSACGKAVASAVETGKQSQERIFSFVKIPLLPSVVRERNRDGDGERGKGANHIPFSPRCYAQATPTPYHSITEATSPPNPLTSNLWLVLAQDTTEQQKATKELAAKNADLVQLNRLKDEFLACISHELKTPLTAVLGLSTLLKDQTLGQLNERQARYARLIYQSGRQLMTVVNDILDLTRMETGQLELMLEPVDIQSVCDRAYAQVRQLHSEKEQEEEITPETHFSLEIEPDLDRLVGDELRLRQMLVHLLSNALKFTNPGGEIGLRVNRWEGWIAFTVWDTGIGIPPEKQHLIFQKFQQLEQPLTRRHEGTGLGLVLTQHLARLHGGDVSFISKLGEGSQFTLLLPPCPPQGREQELNFQEGLQVDKLNGESSNLSFGNGFVEHHSTQPSRNRLVLVVETVPRYLERLTEQLKNLAYRVVVARSGTEAIEKARTLQPYAILLNPLLPKLSGWDVLTLLKSDAETRHIPVLVTATQAEKQQAYHHKADGFLNLPVQEHALLQSLTNLVEPSYAPSRGLTILHVKPDLERICHDSSVVSSELTDVVSLQHSELNCRVLEADDLDQAELLARVWHPDVVLLDGAGIADPAAYLKDFSLHTGLTSLPLVTLDHQTTEAANQITGLSVYPCLAADNSLRIAALLQVLQVAAGMSSQPSILVIDIGDSESKNQEISHTDIQSSPSITSSYPGKVRGGQGGKSTIATSLTPYSSWLQALNQYLQTAGFRSVLSGSWAEVHRHLQDQDIDLVLMRVRDISDSSALLNELIALAHLPNRPPLLVLDHRSKTDSVRETAWQEQEEALLLNDAATGRDESTAELELLLRTLSTQLMSGSSQSMSQLLDRIYQTLTVNS